MILYLNTSTEICRVWLDDMYFEKELGRKMACDTLSFLEDSLYSKKKSWQDLSGLVVFAGPGSFTGLRIGISIFNTLADSLQIPIVAASNSDFTKTNEKNSMDDWRKVGFDRINNGEDDKIALPLYGGEANITKAKK